MSTMQFRLSECADGQGSHPDRAFLYKLIHENKPTLPKSLWKRSALRKALAASSSLRQKEPLMRSAAMSAFPSPSSLRRATKIKQ